MFFVSALISQSCLFEIMWLSYYPELAERDFFNASSRVDFTRYKMAPILHSALCESLNR